ncbi:hypothetical protein F4778DRAFT_786411 [Xylariomycetidae sp. FL2044]|nr:hypothetical protein F4778DRAFT_786411 [Xylariomycetidae sp. FL2044]
MAVSAAVMPKGIVPATVSDYGLPTGYKLGPATWIAPFQEGGENMTFTGKLLDVAAQVKSVRPSYKFTNPATDIDARDLRGVLASRDDLPNRHICGIGKPTLRTAAAMAVAETSKWSDWHLQVGPRVCSLVHCSEQDVAGFWLCNDSPTTEPLVPFAIVGELADPVIEECFDIKTQRGSGQNFLGRFPMNLIIASCK